MRNQGIKQGPSGRGAAFASLVSLLNELKPTRLDLRLVMRFHGIGCMVLGSGTILLPHRFLGEEYSHIAHEFIRLYGCLTLAIGWLVWKSQTIKDGRLARTLSEVFALSYLLQSFVMLRAQFTNPKGHSFLHWQIALLFLAIGGGYGWARWVRTIRDFALPGHAL